MSRSQGGTTITLAVSNELAGAVIGPKGSTLSAIREHTATRCNVESTPTPEGERLVSVTGSSAESVVAGVEAVIEALFSAQRPPSAVSFLVAPSAVGAVIGKGGSTINNIRSQSNADVKMQDDSVRVLNTYARCDVSSPEQQSISSAALQVAHLLYEQYSREGSPDLPDVRHLLNSPGGLGGGRQGTGGGMGMHGGGHHGQHNPQHEQQQQQQQQLAAAAAAAAHHHHHAAAAAAMHHHHAAAMGYAGASGPPDYAPIIGGAPYSPMGATNMYVPTNLLFAPPGTQSLFCSS